MIAIQKIGKSFLGALNYNLKKLHHPDPRQRAELLDTNFAAIDSRMIRQELQMVRSLRPNLNRYVYHTSLNFSNDDKLNNRQLLEIAHEYLRESGYTNNQYLIFRHYDADHPHIHLLVNRICFDGSVVSDSSNYKRSEEILRRLEHRHHLVKVDPSNKAQERAPVKNELEMVLRTGSASAKMILQEKMKQLMGGPTLNLQELIRKGEIAGINFLFNQASTGRITGITYFHDGFKIKGQALGNRYKWAELIKIIDYEQSRDSKAISEANDRTRAKYGQQPASEQRGGGNGLVRADIAKDIPEFGEANAAINSNHAAGGSDGSQDTGDRERPLETSEDADWLDHSPAYNKHDNSFDFNFRLTDDEDDAKKRRRRGLGR